MKYVLLTFLGLTLSCTTINAQFHSSLDFTLGYDFFNLVSGNGSSYIPLVGSPKSHDGYRIGLNGNIRLFDRLVFKSGVRFARHSYLPFGGASYYPEENIKFIEYYYEVYHEYYVEVPLVFRYEISKKRLGVFVESGIALNLHSFAKREIITDRYYKLTYDISYPDPKNPLSHDVQDFDLPYLQNSRLRVAFVAGIGVQYSLNKSYQIFVLPMLRYFQPINNSSVQPMLNVGKNINLGIELGVRKGIRFE